MIASRWGSSSCQSLDGGTVRQTIERGRDPRDFVLIAYGGAGPMHACEVAAEVGITRVVVPLFAGHFSAIGKLGVNLRFDRREIFRAGLDEVDRAALSRRSCFRRMMCQCVPRSTSSRCFASVTADR